MELGTIISLGSLAVSAGKALFDVVSDVRKGSKTKPVVQQLEQLNTTVEKLSDHIYYAPNMQVVRDTQTTVQRVVQDLREVRQSLEPIQRVIGQDILSSARILTPEKMQQALIRNPWEVLIDVRPDSMATPHSNPDMAPIHFDHSGINYMGWQMRGTIPKLFDCEYNPDGIA